MITLPPPILSLLNSNALFVLNDSGGKDSQAMRIALQSVIPARQKLVIHASLGDVEWPGALEHAQAGALHDGIPFLVARATKTFFEMVDRRHEQRPHDPCWPSSSSRQCTSDLKRDPIAREIRRYSKANRFTSIVNCVGIRKDESTARSKLNPCKRSDRNSAAGREWWDWLPIFTLTRDQVFKTVANAGEKLHYAYGLGNDRLSCMLCIFGSKNDLKNAAIRNPELYRRYVEKERATGYTMHMSRLSLPQLTGIDI